MKNKYSLLMTVKEDCIEIEGICPHCMNNTDLLEFTKCLNLVNLEVIKVLKERKLYGEKIKSEKKKRQKDFRKSCR